MMLRFTPNNQINLHSLSDLLLDGLVPRPRLLIKVLKVTLNQNTT